MKNTIIYFFIFLSFFCKDDKLFVEGLLKTYKINQEIEFIIFNNYNQKKYYYISIEYYQNNQWRELINDVDNPQSNSSLIKIIKSKNKIKTSISTKKIFYLENFLIFEKYRIKISYGNSINNLNKCYISDSFIILSRYN